MSNFGMMWNESSWNCSTGARLTVRSIDSILQSYNQDGGQIKGRNREKESIRRLTTLLHPNSEIQKDVWGKPFIPNGPHINYSHSSSHVLWGEHADHAIGVDIENERPQLIKLQSKFCSTEELSYLDTCEPLSQLLLIWSAKESIYKAYGKKALDFKLHMQISAFKASTEGTLEAVLNIEKEIPLSVHYKRMDTSVATWCVLP
jgi:phosphopantetheinyl transferase